MEQRISLTLELIEKARALFGDQWHWVLWALFAAYVGRALAQGYRLLRDHAVIPHRRYRRVKALIESVGKFSEVSSLLHQLGELEAFQSATGVRAGWRHVLALSHLCREGLLSPNELKGMARFIDTADDGSITAKFNGWDCFVFWFLSGYAWLAFATGVLVWVMLILKDPVPGAIVGLMLFMGFLFGSALVMGEANIHGRAKRLKVELELFELPICQALARNCK